MYASQDGMILAYGQDNIAKWSSYATSKTAALNESRITQAVRWADARVTALLQYSPYTLPVADETGAVPAEVEIAANDLAGWWLWQTRALKETRATQKLMQDRAHIAIRTLMDIRQGNLPIPAIKDTTSRNIPITRGH